MLVLGGVYLFSFSWTYALNEQWLPDFILLVFGQRVLFRVCGTVREWCQQACSLHYCDHRHVSLQFPDRPDLYLVPIDFHLFIEVFRLVLGWASSYQCVFC